MIKYRIGILPLINNIKQEVPDITQIWYAHDARALGVFAILEIYFDFLTRQGPGRGYQPNPTKSILIVRPENLEARKVFGARHEFRVCTGARYIGGYIGDDDYERDWLRDSTLMWEKNINTIRETAGKYPQESYAAVVHSIQSEWIFLQRVTWDTGDSFTGVENMIRETFPPCLFFGGKKRSPL